MQPFWAVAPKPLRFIEELTSDNPRGVLISHARLFKRVEVADMEGPTANADTRAPLPAYLIDATLTGRVVLATWRVPILLSLRCWSQVLPPIVARVSAVAAVVDRLERFLAGHHFPDYPVCLVGYSVDSDLSVAARTGYASRLPRAFRVPRLRGRMGICEMFARALAPRQHAGQRIIDEAGEQIFA